MLNELGTTLILLGLALLIFVFVRRKPKGKSVSADRGSIAIGGNSYGPVSNVQSGSGGSDGAGWHVVLTVVACAVEIVGIVLTVWEHSASK